MANIFINGMKSKSGGGKSILNNYLALLRLHKTKDKYFVLTPDATEYIKYSCDFIEVIEINRLYKINILFPILYYIIMPRLFRNYNIDLVFNFGDIIIPTTLPQLYLFDWAYAVYPESIVWKKMDYHDYLMRKIKMFIILNYIKYATLVIAQTKNIKERLISIYNLERVIIVPNAVSLENIDSGELYDFKLPKNKKKLLYLTYYYSHKNIEILIPLAMKIKEMALPYCIITTIERYEHKHSKLFIDRIKNYKLDDIIINVGNVKMPLVPSLYQQCDALFMPTLLESYGLPYFEAMYHGKTIFTSDLNFAKDVCGNAAFYFDPLDVNSIIYSISNAFKHNELCMNKIEEGKELLRKSLNWNEVFSIYQELLKNILMQYCKNK